MQFTDGFLGYVQGTGKEPKDSQPVTYDKVPDFEDFGTGCFLLAGSENLQIRPQYVTDKHTYLESGLSFTNRIQGKYILRFTSLPFLVSRRRYSKLCLKTFTEIKRIINTHFIRNFRNSQIPFGQKQFGSLLHSYDTQILIR